MKINLKQILKISTMIILGLAGFIVGGYKYTDSLEKKEES